MLFTAAVHPLSQTPFPGVYSRTIRRFARVPPAKVDGASVSVRGRRSWWTLSDEETAMIMKALRNAGLYAGFLAGMLLAGCPADPSRSDTTPAVEDGETGSGGGTGDATTDGTGNVDSTDSSGNPVDPGADLPFSSSSISVVARAGGPRTDPEGVAPPANETTLLTWHDSRGHERTLTLGAYLYQYDFSFSDGINEVTRSANDDAWGHEGFGYVVSHNTQNGNSPIGKVNPATKIETTIFAGGHHALYRVEMLYDRDKEGGGNGIKIPVVIEWMVATGRDHPVWAVNWKTGEAINPNNIDFNVYRMDTRGPYGSLNFDGAAARGEGDAVGTVAWGDFALRFTTLDNMLSLQSPWSYNTSNRVPFTYASTANTNAEMGIVRTLADDKQMGVGDRVVGRERGSTSAAVYPNRGDCNGYGDARVYSVPCIQGWPYQLMNFDWDPGTGKPITEATSTKLLAWGTPYGFLGASSFDLFDFSGTADGRGDRAYATLIVLGPKGRFNPQSLAFDQAGDVALALQQIESLADATITDITLGAIVAEAPRGPQSSQTRPIANGYNDIYATHHIRAADGGVAFQFTPGAAAVTAPIFVIENYTARRLPKITLDGADLSINGDTSSGAFVSLDEAGKRLWVTINRSVAAPAAIRITP